MVNANAFLLLLIKKAYRKEKNREKLQANAPLAGFEFARKDQRKNRIMLKRVEGNAPELCYDMEIEI